MRAMVLAAGLGTRLRPLTDTLPKPLVDVLGHPLIAYPLGLLRRAGIVDVAVNLHHLGDQVRAALGDGREFGLRLTYFPEDPILDSGGAIGNARAFLDGGPFLVLNADTVADIDLREVIAFHEARRAAVTLVVRPDRQAAEYGVVEVARNRRIARIRGIPRQLPGGVDEPLEGMMFAGIQVLEPSVFRYMGTGIYSTTRKVYPEMLAAGEPIYGYVYDGFWRVLDTHEGLAEGLADRRLLRLADRLATVS